MKQEKILLPREESNAKSPWLWIGTWSMGGEGFGSHDERESLRVLETSVENGIRHFDTAGFYAHGRSEELLRKVISGKREEIFVSTKGGLVWDGRRVEHRASPEELEAQLHESFRRLKTDYIDLYQLHWPDPEVPISESIEALREFQGKEIIRYWGVGNLNAVQLKEHLSSERDIPHQVHYNPVNRNDGVLAEGKDVCINCVTSPLEQGLLGSGKSSQGIEGIGKKDMRNSNPFFSDPEVLQWTEKLDELCSRFSVSKVVAVLLWICSRPHVHALIPGPKRTGQLKELLALKHHIDNNDLLASSQTDTILSGDGVSALIPDEILEHLNRGVPAKGN